MLAKARGCDLLVTHSHGRQAAARLKIPFLSHGHPDVRPARRAGIRLMVGYRGARDLIFDIGNLLMADHEENHEPTPESLA